MMMPQRHHPSPHDSGIDVNKQQSFSNSRSSYIDSMIMTMNEEKNNNSGGGDGDGGDYYNLPLSIQQKYEPRRFHHWFPRANSGNQNGASAAMPACNSTTRGFGLAFETQHHHDKKGKGSSSSATANASRDTGSDTNYAVLPTEDEHERPWELDDQKHGAAPVVDRVHNALVNGISQTKIPNTDTSNNGFFSIGSSSSTQQNSIQKILWSASTVINGTADTAIPTATDRQQQEQQQQQQQQEQKREQQQSELDDAEFERCARRTLDEAIKGIPSVESSAYSEALRRTPHLVETESDPLCFLRFEQFNSWDAAVRIVAYWEERKKVFGPERYLFPLTLTGKSALIPEAIRELRRGTALMLPKDQSGRSVMYLNQYRFRQLSYQVKFQLVFYGYYMAMRNELSQSEGFVLFFHKFNEKNTPRIHEITRILRCVMPVHNYAIHVFTPSVIDPIRLRLAMWFTNQKVFMHLCHTPEERAAKLSPFGFSKDRLPSILGGSWEIVQWDGVGQDFAANCLARSSNSNSNSDNNNDNGLNNDNNVVVCDNHNLLSLSNSMDQHCSESGSALSLGSWDVQNDNSTSPNHEPLITVKTFFETEDSNEQDERIKKQSSSRLLVAGDKSQPNPNRKRRRQTIWDKNNVQPGVCQANETDVLFGKGRNSCRHPGNKVFRAVIEQHSKQYDEARSTSQKVRIRRAVYDCIRQRGSRFLMFDQKKGEWFEVVEEIADKKIAQTLRNFRKGHSKFPTKLENEQLR